ncbi:Protoglobin-domain-containing protein [Tuber brumale]|nr:Protoglobin-domain-containing protein [Tuber brumale]
MQSIDPKSLSTLPTRIAYLKSFIDFTHADAAALHAARPVVEALIPSIVEAVYKKLLSFDITAKAFVPRQTGYDGVAPTKVEELNLEHPMVKFRMGFLKGYLKKLVVADYDDLATWDYFDKVGIMHTGVAGFAHRAKKPGLRVEYIHMGLLLGYVVDLVIAAVLAHPDLDNETKSAVLRALNKVIWIQNDLFARHYVVDLDTPNSVAVPKNGLLHGWVGQIVTGFVVAVGVFGVQTILRGSS